MEKKCPTCGFGLPTDAATEKCLYCTSGITQKKNGDRTPTSRDENSNENGGHTGDDPTSEHTRTIAAPLRMLDADPSPTPSDTPAINASEIYQSHALRYELNEVLGEGGMGRVVKARDNDLQRSVAVKILHTPLRNDEELVERFVEEARITGQLQHPNIIPLHELSFDKQGSPFYTMKQVRGLTLRHILTGIRAGDTEMIAHYPLSRLLTIFVKMCDAVAYAHSRGVLHRDLKPENVMTGDFGEVVVMDWGLSKVLGKTDRRSPLADGYTVIDSTKMIETQYGRIIGTPQYMSPEQAIGRTGQIDARSDLYTLGVILYEMLTLSSAFQSDSVDGLLDDIIYGKAPDISSFKSARNPDGTLCVFPHLPQGRVPDSLAAIVRKAMQTDPAERYQHVQELQADIEAYQSGFATEAEQAGVLRQVNLFVRRNKVLTASAALIGILLVTSSVINFRERKNAERALAQYEAEQVLRKRQEQQSAPAFVASAKALANTEGIDDALVIVRKALDYDPDLAEAYGLKAILHLIRQENDLARAAVDAYLQRSPTDIEFHYLKNSLINHEGNPVPLHDIANVVSQKGYVQLAGKLRQRHAEKFNRDREWLPVYRRQVAKLEPTKELQTALSVDVVWGLSFRHVDDNHLGVLDNLQFLKGIPLRSLEVGVLDRVDAAPLVGMPLRRLVAWERVNMHSLIGIREFPELEYLMARGIYRNLEPIAGMPLKLLKLEGEFTDLSPLKGMALDSLYIDGAYTDVTPLKDLTFVSLSLLTKRNYSSLKFLYDHPETSYLRLRHFPIDGDYTPLLSNKTVRHFEEDYDLREMTTFGRTCGQVYKKAIDLVLEEKYAEAQAEIRHVTEQIENPALALIKETGYIFEHLILRKLDPNHALPQSHFTSHHEDTSFVWLACHADNRIFPRLAEKLNVSIACVHTAEDNHRIASMLAKPAYSGVYKVDAMIGASRTRSEDSWAWRDGKPWGFSFWKKLNADNVGGVYIRQDGQWEVHDETWESSVILEYKNTASTVQSTESIRSRSPHLPPEKVEDDPAVKAAQ